MEHGPGARSATTRDDARSSILHAFKTALPETAGGVLTVMDDLADGLAGEFCSTFLVASNRPHLFAGGGRSAAVSTVRHLGYFMSLPLAPTYPLRLMRAARAHDLVALHAPFPLADLAGLAGTFDRTPLVVHWHSEIVRQTGFRMLYERPMRSMLASARRIIVSAGTLIDTSPFLRPHQGKCVVAPFGVDHAYWNALGAEDRAAVAATRERHPRLVLAVGRLVSYKGFHVLIDAMRAIDGELWIVGTGPLQSFLEERIGEAGAGGKVRLLGALPDAELRRLYHAARLLAVPSVSAAETFGIVQIEAMACGLPVVNTALPTGVPEVARDGSEALTVPPENSAALAGAINRLLDDEELARRLGRAASARVAAAFRRADFLETVAAAYRDAISMKPPR